MRFWVVRRNSQDTGPGGVYRYTARVAGPFSNPAAAEEQQRKLTRELSNDQIHQGVHYWVWSDDQIEQAQRLGTEVSPVTSAVQADLYCFECGRALGPDEISYDKCYHCGMKVKGYATEVQWETCVIDLTDMQDDNTQYWEDARFRARFIAEASRDSRPYTAAISKEWVFFPPAIGLQQNLQTEDVLNSFIKKLTADGWQQAGMAEEVAQRGPPYGARWYNLKFRRPVPK